MIAHGTGVAPFVSILERICHDPSMQNRKISLFYGVRNDREELLFKEELIGFLKTLNS